MIRARLGRLPVMAALAACLLLCGASIAQETPDAPPDAVTEADAPEGSLTVPLGMPKAGGGLSDVVKILVFLSVLSLLPAIVLTMTSFTRIVIVLSFVRRAVGLQQMPPNTIVIGLAMFLTAFLMAPVWKTIHTEAIGPLMKKQISEAESVELALAPLRKFMLRHTRHKDLALFVRVARLPKPQTAQDVPTYVLIPAFAISEIKTAFLMGFVVFLPMLIVDLVIATLLASMGMFMLPPMLISMPVKVLLFVLVDGWYLVIGSLVRSFQVFS